MQSSYFSTEKGIKIMSAEEYVRNVAKRKGWIKYYMLHRPVSIGTQPQKGFMDFINYDNKTNVNGISAWAEVYYDRLLDQEELDKYEMMKGEEL